MLSNNTEYPILLNNKIIYVIRDLSGISETFLKAAFLGVLIINKGRKTSSIDNMIFNIIND